MRSVLLDKVRIRYIPRTSGMNDPAKKEELRDKILEALVDKKIDLDLLRQRCINAKYLSLDVIYNIFQHQKELGRTRKDIDNMLKLLLDILPERFSVQDKTKEHIGLGLILGDDDAKIFEIHSLKKKVVQEEQEGIELEIYELSEEDVTGRIQY